MRRIRAILCFAISLPPLGLFILSIPHMIDMLSESASYSSEGWGLALGFCGIMLGLLILGVSYLKTGGSLWREERKMVAIPSPGGVKKRYDDAVSHDDYFYDEDEPGKT